MRQYNAVVYIEGLRFPLISATVKSSPWQGLEINVSIPAISGLQPIWEFDTTAATEEDEDGQFVAASGIQPGSMLHIFLIDEKSEEEMLLAEGYVQAVSRSVTSQGANFQVSARGNMTPLTEIKTYMTDFYGGLEGAYPVQYQSTFDHSQVQPIGEIISTIFSEGISKGVVSLLENAATDLNDRANLTWLLYKMSNKIAVIGGKDYEERFWDGDELVGALQDKIQELFSTNGQMSPILDAIMAMLQFCRFHLVSNIAPSFININYPEEDGIKPSLMQISEDDINPNILPDHSDKIMLGDILIFPDLPFAPPPRCNVIFPDQYNGYTFTESFNQRPTRGWCKTTLAEAENAYATNVAIFPEWMEDHILTSERLRWNSPEELYRGVVFSQFTTSRPDWLLTAPDYVEGSLKQLYERNKYVGNSINLIASGFNPNPVVGLPILILSKDKSHLVGMLQGIGHSITPSGLQTNYQISDIRDYREPVPENTSELFWSSPFFDASVVGCLIYPQILGKRYAYSLTELAKAYPLFANMNIQTVLDLEGASSNFFEGLSSAVSPFGVDIPTPEATVLGKSIEELVAMNPILENIDLSTITVADLIAGDMSILAHLSTLEDPSGLYNLLGENYEEFVAAKKGSDAIKRAADLLYEEYSNSGNLEAYSYNYGRRIFVGREQLFCDFYGCTKSTDMFSFSGGYSVKDNSITPPEGDAVEIGTDIQDDFDIAGCFVREKQAAIASAASTALSLVEETIFQDISQIMGDGALEVGVDLVEGVSEETETDTTPGESEET